MIRSVAPPIGEMLPPAARQRGLFPLPDLFGPPVEKCLNSPHSRSSRLRLKRRLEEDRRAVEAVLALNELAGCGDEALGSGPQNAQQDLVKTHVLSAVRDLAAFSTTMSPAEAFGELRGASIYEEDPSGPVRDLDPVTVSLPEAGSRPVPLATLYGDGGEQFVQEFLTKALAQTETVEAALERAPAAPYMDENFRRQRPAYVAFLRRLIACNMIELTAKAGREQVGVFGVAKKNGKVRMVIDCRRSNAWFVAPPHVQLATGSSLSQLSVEPGQSFWVAGFDIRNAFYSFELPAELRDYFCLPPATAGELGISLLDGHPLDSEVLLYPRFRILPMGWTHALWWCQLLHRRILEHRAGFDSARLVIDRGPPPALTPWCYSVYVDNAIFIGTDRSEVDGAMRRALAAVTAAGLPTHEVSSACQEADVLGWRFDGRRALIRAKPERMKKLQLALEWGSVTAGGRH